MTPWCKLELLAFIVLRGDLAKRLFGVGVIWPKDSLVLIQPWHQGFFWPNYPNQHQGVFWPDHAPIVKVPNFIPGVWFGLKTHWCWNDLVKSFLCARAESAPRSLLARSPQHQGVFWPNPKTKILSQLFGPIYWLIPKSDWLVSCGFSQGFRIWS